MKQVLAVLLAANVLAPSGILASPAKYERKNVTVLGIVQGIAMRAIPGGVITQFALCDSRCINVVEFSKPSFYVGQSLTVAGTFHQIFSNGIIQARNTVVVTAPLP
ncbi:MAG: hypothetical protein WA629_08695 [Candidatus Aquilonibacter sp.]